MIDRFPAACALALLPLPTALAQNFEHDLRPPRHEDWREAGTAVDIDGDWALVSGVPVSPQSGAPVGDDLPAMFHFDSARGEWEFAQSLVHPGIIGFPFALEHAAVDAPHALLGSARTTLPRLVTQPWLLDTTTGTWSSLPPITSPVSGESRFGEVLGVDGDNALIADFGYQGRGVVHRFEFDTISQQWSFAETWTAPNGLGSFGFGLDLDGDTGAVSDLEANTSLSSRVHVYEKGTGGWSLLQTITGGQGTTSPSWLYGALLALDGNLLLIANDNTVEVFRRPIGGQPFAYDTTIDLGPNHVATSLDVENGTIVVGQHYDFTGGPASSDGLVEVYRFVPCLGSGWQRTHSLRTAHRHNGSVHLGTAVAISQDRIVAGMSDYIFLNGPFHGLRAGAASVFDVPRDCNGNGLEDTCEILAGEADVDGDGVLDECEAVGRRYCSPGNPTFLGAPAYVMLQGSDRTSEDRLFFTFVGVPQGAPSLMLASRQAGFAAQPAGSNGDLCLGEPIGRFAGRTHSYWFAGGDGVISQRYPLTSPLPGGGPMLTGETWFFQGWFREAGSSNFTDAIQLVMR